jgi:hypothetical protein
MSETITKKQPIDLPRPPAPAGFWVDGKCRFVPEAAIKPADLLMDQLVRKQIGYALPLHDEIARFKGYCMDEIAALRDLIDQEYGVTRGGEKGNITIYSFDTLYKIQVQVSDYISFGVELQSAKALVDECLLRWSEGSQAELIAVVNQAFDVDKEGKINRSALFGLRRLHIEDAGWKRAMEALGDSMRVIGSKEYIRFYRRETVNMPWQPVSLDLATIEAIRAAS